VTADWQSIAALAIVIAAVAFLVRKVWRAATSKQRPGCGSCGSCPSSRPGKSLVSIDLAPPVDRRESAPK
jgi:hypothetical protein